MDTITLTASITYPVANIEAFADARGYQSKVANPNYVPAQGNEFLFDETSMAELLDEEGNRIPNPDYVPAVGESIIDNPQSRIDFVKEWFKAQAVELFSQDFKRDAQKQAQEIAKQIEETAKDQIRAAITIE